MMSFLLILVLCRALSFAWPVLQNTEQDTERDIQLVQQKYLDSDLLQEEPSPVSRSPFNNVSAEQVQQMQEYLGAEATSKPDLNNLDVMKRPRCGVSDLDAYILLGPKWDHTDLTYRITNYTPDMSRADVKETFKKAFKMWSDVSPLTFKEIFNSSADIKISFGSGVHSEDKDDCPFDGESGVLAHAFYPGFRTNVDIHFDESENWTMTKTGTNLHQVAVHEIGHTLGLKHSKNSQAVMYDSYHVTDPATFRLHQDDIDGIQALYGHPEDGQHDQKYQSDLGKLLAKQNAADLCDPNRHFDAVTTYNGTIYFFRHGGLIMKNPMERDAKIARISDFWPLLKCGIDACYEAEGILYFFKGRKYWTFNEYTKEISSPDFITKLGIPPTNKIDAAVYDQKTKDTLFFSGDEYWRYDVTLKHMKHHGKIAYFFPKIGSNVDAAFQFKGRLYLLRGPNQYEFDRKTYRLLAIKKVNTWFGCQE